MYYFHSGTLFHDKYLYSVRKTDSPPRRSRSTHVRLHGNRSLYILQCRTAARNEDETGTSTGLSVVHELASYGTWNFANLGAQKVGRQLIFRHLLSLVAAGLDLLGAV